MLGQNTTFIEKLYRIAKTYEMVTEEGDATSEIDLESLTRVDDVPPGRYERQGGLTWSQERKLDLQNVSISKMQAELFNVPEEQLRPQKDPVYYDENAESVVNLTNVILSDPGAFNNGEVLHEVKDAILSDYFGSDPEDIIDFNASDNDDYVEYDSWSSGEAKIDFSKQEIDYITTNGRKNQKILQCNISSDPKRDANILEDEICTSDNFVTVRHQSTMKDADIFSSSISSSINSNRSIGTNSQKKSPQKRKNCHYKAASQSQNFLENPRRFKHDFIKQCPEKYFFSLETSSVSPKIGMNIPEDEISTCDNFVTIQRQSDPIRDADTSSSILSPSINSEGSIGTKLQQKLPQNPENHHNKASSILEDEICKADNFNTVPRSSNRSFEPSFELREKIHIGCRADSLRCLKQNAAGELDSSINNEAGESGVGLLNFNSSTRKKPTKTVGQPQWNAPDRMSRGSRFAASSDFESDENEAFMPTVVCHKKHGKLSKKNVSLRHAGKSTLSKHNSHSKDESLKKRGKQLRNHVESDTFGGYDANLVRKLSNKTSQRKSTPLRRCKSKNLKESENTIPERSPERLYESEQNARILRSHSKEDSVTSVKIEVYSSPRSSQMLTPKIAVKRRKNPTKSDIYGGHGVTNHTCKITGKSSCQNSGRIENTSLEGSPELLYKPQYLMQDSATKAEENFLSPEHLKIILEKIPDYIVPDGEGMVSCSKYFSKKPEAAPVDAFPSPKNLQKLDVENGDFSFRRITRSSSKLKSKLDENKTIDPKTTQPRKRKRLFHKKKKSVQKKSDNVDAGVLCSPVRRIELSTPN